MFIPFNDPQALLPDTVISQNVVPKCTNLKVQESWLDNQQGRRVSWLKWQKNAGVLFRSTAVYLGG